MTSKRRAVCRNALAAFLGYFLLTLGLAAAVQAQVPTNEIGPVEKRARPITPENPIPKRIYSVDPIYPPEAASISATARVTVRAVLDEFGRVVEVRRLSLPIVTAGSQPKPDPVVLKFATEAMLEAAGDAVRRWQYEAPIEGPIAFDVSFRFAPGSVTFIGSQTGGVQQTVTVRPGAAPPASLPETPGSPTSAPTPTGGVAAGAVRVGGTVRPPQMLSRMSPVYPPEALEAKVEGVVILEAVIGTDGGVADVRVLRSIPMLDQAATNAVRQWRYSPTLVEGKTVPVIMTVTVQFSLN